MIVIGVVLGIIAGLGLYKLKEIAPLKFKGKLGTAADWLFIFSLGAMVGVGYMMVSVK